MKATNTVVLEGSECSMLSDGLINALEYHLGMKKSKKEDCDSETLSSLIAEINGARTITIIAEK